VVLVHPASPGFQLIQDLFASHEGILPSGLSRST
jgi:hypothetical protein